jgi:hypothetical protein
MNDFAAPAWSKLRLLVLAVVLFPVPVLRAAEEPNPLYSCTFTPAGWNAKDWMFVRRRDMKTRDEWIQGAEFITNPDTTPDGHTSMVYGQKLQGNLTVTATMAFADRMAPSIVLASKLGDDATGKREYEQHIEIVLWEQGINVWSHHTEAGKSIWKQTAFSRVPIEKDKKYPLQVTKKGKELSITVAGQTIGYLEESLADEFYVGISGEEGECRFYDFEMRRL